MTTDTPLLLSDDPITEPTVFDLAVTHTSVMRHKSVTLADLREIYDRSLTQAAEAGPIGPPFGIYNGDPSKKFDIEVGVPIAEDQQTGKALASRFPFKRVLALSHVGSYAELGNTWASFTSAIDPDSHELTGRFAEIYVADPSTSSPEDLRTDLLLEIVS